MHTKKRFVAIGHITNDVGEPDRVGGGVSYTAVTAVRLGHDAHIITKCPPHHPHVAALARLGVTVHVLPSTSGAITTFENVYDARGRRTQYCPLRQEAIRREDFAYIPHAVLKNAIILAAPVANEVDPALFPLLAAYGTLALAPQGYFRTFQEDGAVVPRLWPFTHEQEHLRSVSVAILSDEDVSVFGTPDLSYVEELRRCVPCLILTRGAIGSTVYTKERTVAIQSFRLSAHEQNDFTGAGDVYAAAFLVFREQYAFYDAARYASLYAALKIYGFGEIGINAIPTMDQVQRFAAHHFERVMTLLPARSIIASSIGVRK